MCQVVDCEKFPTQPFVLKETDELDFPAVVAVCGNHEAELRNGAEYRLDHGTGTFYVGDSLKQSGKVYLLGVEGVSEEAGVVTNREDDEGAILRLKVRRAGSDTVENIEVEASPAAVDNLRYWLNSPLLQGSSSPFEE